jgi:hypothetical protein
MRYQEWWFTEFPKQFTRAGFEVLTLGENYYKMICKIVENMDEDEPNIVKGNFAPLVTAINFEHEQVSQYMNLKLKDDDILFCTDLSFPGFFTNVLYHKRPKQAYVFCHATSLNDYDYFQKVRYSKFQVEKANALMFDRVFVASHYHQHKLEAWDFPKNLKVVGVPSPPKNIIGPIQTEEKRFLISVSRPLIQKVDFDIEKDVEQQYGQKIYRPDCRTWEDYCKALSESRVMLVTAREETFGYQILDAIINNCIPVTPNAFSYRELIPREYRYNNTTELFDVLDKALVGQLSVPELLCKTRINNFYDNIIKIIRKERE